jgi:hypothetical protein
MYMQDYCLIIPVIEQDLIVSWVPLMQKEHVG